MLERQSAGRPWRYYFSQLAYFVWRGQLLFWRAMPARIRGALAIVIVALLGAALAYWAKGFRDLVSGRERTAAIDLHLRWVDQQYVINRQNPFDVSFAHRGNSEPAAAVCKGRNASVIGGVGVPGGASYPAWSYFSGYPLFCLPWNATRIYYAALQLTCLIWLLRWAFLQGREVDVWCGAFCAAGVAATASFCTTLEIGQYGILVLALLTGSLQLEEAGSPIAAGLLAGIACLKPNIAAPFLLYFLVRRRWRALAAAMAYLSVASLWIWIAIHTNPLETLQQMMHGSESFVQTGYGPVAAALALGMKAQFATPLIAVFVVAISLPIIMQYRRRPALQLFAVVGVVARFWSYHKAYDNLSIVFLLVALSKLGWERPTRVTVVSLAAVGASLWLPARVTDLFCFQIVQCLVWIAGVGVMLAYGEPTRRDERDSVAASSIAPTLNAQ